jgi:hypothetical protein
VRGGGDALPHSAQSTLTSRGIRLRCAARVAYARSCVLPIGLRTFQALELVAMPAEAESRVAGEYQRKESQIRRKVCVVIMLTEELYSLAVNIPHRRPSGQWRLS